jgi:hypothetical protein
LLETFQQGERAHSTLQNRLGGSTLWPMANKTQKRKLLTIDELARMGGQAVLRKYGRAQLRKWGKLGGRPRKSKGRRR